MIDETIKQLSYRVEDFKVIKNVLMTTGYIFFSEGHKLLGMWPARSGGYGNGTITYGRYQIGACNRIADIPENKAYKREGYPWCVELIVPEYIDRTGLMIHPDGNIPGSLGCLVLTERDISFYELVSRDIRDQPEMFLRCV